MYREHPTPLPGYLVVITINKYWLSPGPNGEPGPCVNLSLYLHLPILTVQGSIFLQKILREAGGRSLSIERFPVFVSLGRLTASLTLETAGQAAF